MKAYSKILCYFFFYFNDAKLELLTPRLLLQESLEDDQISGMYEAPPPTLTLTPHPNLRQRFETARTIRR